MKKRKQEKYFHGEGKSGSYFEGWYLKHQCHGKTVAFIPAIHADTEGNWTASIQVIINDGVNDGSWYIPYPIEECEIGRDRFFIRIGENLFSEKGIKIKIENSELSVSGKIAYSKFRKIKGDIMGFFRFFPFMQCSHGIISMSHGLKGNLNVNGERVNFTKGRGYIETDRGKSFPKEYLWTQCGFGIDGRDSLMVSAADIPFLGCSFRGCICAIQCGGREYRMGTYYGARVVEYGEGHIILKQGRMVLEATKLAEHSFGLHAPELGNMERIIKESPACRVRYQFRLGKRLLFDITSDRASFEQVR